MEGVGVGNGENDTELLSYMGGLCTVKKEKAMNDDNVRRCSGI